MRLQVCRGIFLDVGFDFGKHVGHLYGFRRCGLVQPMLVQDVVGDGKQIGLRATNRLMPRHAQKAQIDFLHEVRNVSGCVAKPRRQEPTQPLTVVAYQGSYEGLLIVCGQRGAVRKTTVS